MASLLGREGELQIAYPHCRSSWVLSLGFHILKLHEASCTKLTLQKERLKSFILRNELPQSLGVSSLLLRSDVSDNIEKKPENIGNEKPGHSLLLYQER